ncbi:MAG TPA: YraN family protein [Ferruginibacter sp.]|nr:YraN family protein [Ferruginibacter sp.]HRO17622.1 YraN family protein [Ferruginibacter sp.]HRQ21622.1 YraN family protein [Ferruginibacter sp.]
MAAHNDTGKEGEALAIAFFRERDYLILHTNWRWRHLEIDLVATKGNYLHFIEVKTRTSEKFGKPEAGVSRKKLRNLQDAAAAYLHTYPTKKRVQFDVLSILISPAGPNFTLIEDHYVW